MSHPLLLSGRAICNIIPQRYPSTPFSFYSHALSCLHFQASTPTTPSNRQRLLIVVVVVMIVQSCFSSLPGLGDHCEVGISWTETVTSFSMFPKLCIPAEAPEVRSIASKPP